MHVQKVVRYCTYRFLSIGSRSQNPYILTPVFTKEEDVVSITARQRIRPKSGTLLDIVRSDKCLRDRIEFIDSNRISFRSFTCAATGTVLVGHTNKTAGYK